MLYSIKNVEDLGILNELVSLENQVKAVRLQDKLGKQNFHEDMKKVFEPVTKSIKVVSQDITKTIMKNSNKKTRVFESLNEKLFQIMNDTGIFACYLLSSSSKTTQLEITSQFNLVKVFNPNR